MHAFYLAIEFFFFFGGGGCLVTALAILVAEAWVLPLLSLSCSTVNFIYLCFWFTISYFLWQVNLLLVLAKLLTYVPCLLVEYFTLLDSGFQ